MKKIKRRNIFGLNKRPFAKNQQFTRNEKKIQKHHLGDYFSSLYIILVAESSTPTPESEDTFLVKTFCLVKNHQFVILFAFHQNSFTLFNMTVVFLQSQQRSNKSIICLQQNNQHSLLKTYRYWNATNKITYPVCTTLINIKQHENTVFNVHIIIALVNHVTT